MEGEGAGNEGRLAMSSQRDGLLLLGCSALLVVACGEPAHRELAWEAMGTTAAAEIYTRTEPDAESAIQEIRSRIEAAATELDPRSDDGELGRLNRHAADEFYSFRQLDLYACLKLALDYARESQGAYDPTLGVLRRLYETRVGTASPPRPTEVDVALGRVGWEKVTVEPEAMAVQFRTPGLQVDLGAVGQGCALDWAARIFARPGSLAGLLRVDGVYRVWEHPPEHEHWSVAIRDPRKPDRDLLTLRILNRGIAACGQRELEEGSPLPAGIGPPLLDPRTGLPVASDLLAVVTTADSAADAAALCEAVYVAGSLQGPGIFQKTRRTEAILVVRADGGTPYLLASASLEGRMELSAELNRETGGEIRYLLPPGSL